ncbi:MAG: A/G-specific adenine glycosylase [Patescibacteria group bacterium]|nr:A/G-specific adenine glycosylase [Patescibacteria group bacterium]
MYLAEFRRTVQDFYFANKRILPWREKRSHYGVFVSEIMLQQTQVPRVLIKYTEFTKRFPDFRTLANASLSDVLTAWQGLGYNRRGIYLRQAAKLIIERYGGSIPKSVDLVDELPGVGKATAAAIVTYTHNIPVVFIETNVRRVFLHHFFAGQENVDDRELEPIVSEALDRKNPRDWYYALMDYGTYLARSIPNPNRRSRHYTTQTPFEGSIRQARGAILRYLLQHGNASEDTLRSTITSDKVDAALAGMVRDGIVELRSSLYFLRE